MFDTIKVLIKNTIINFKINCKQVVLFEMAYKLLVLLLFIPLTKTIINASLLEMGLFNLTNTELLKEVSNYAVIIALICITIVSFIGVFIEITTITLIANKSRQNIKVSYIKEFINAIKLLKDSISIYIFPIVLLLAVLGPVTQIGLYTSLIKSIEIPDFIIGELFKLAYGKVILYSFLFVMIVILSRWIYSIIAIAVEDINLKEAFENSIKINKNSRGKTILYIFAWGFINFIIKLILVVVYMVLFIAMMKIVGDRSTLAEYMFMVGIIIFLAGYSLISLVTIPLTITFILELYYKFINYEPSMRRFKVEKINKDNKILNFIIIFLFVISVIFTTATNLVDSYSDNVSITAHRGSSLTAPENTLVSIEHAVQKRADYAEIDVMTTKDNNVVLFHDPTLKRIDKTNRKIKNMTLEEVKKVDNGSYFGEEFKGEQIPTLEEVFKEYKGKIKFNIELKPVGEDDVLAKEVAKLIEKYKMNNEVVVSCLDKNTILNFEENNPDIDTGYIVSFAFGELEAINVDFISMEYSLLTRTISERLHANDKKVHVWTLNDEDRIIRAISIGADNIITDDVLMAKRVMFESKYRILTPMLLLKEQSISYPQDIHDTYKEYIEYLLANANYIVWFRDTIIDIISYVVI